MPEVAPLHRVFVGIDQDATVGSDSPDTTKTKASATSPKESSPAGLKRLIG
jgi:hypothetical protein